MPLPWSTDGWDETSLDINVGLMVRPCLVIPCCMEITVVNMAIFDHEIGSRMTKTEKQINRNPSKSYATWLWHKLTCLRNLWFYNMCCWFLMVPSSRMAIHPDVSLEESFDSKVGGNDLDLSSNEETFMEFPVIDGYQWIVMHMKRMVVKWYDIGWYNQHKSTS